MFRSTLLIGAALWAGTSPTKSKWLRSYFAAHVIYNLLPMLAGAMAFDSTAYLALYSARTFLWLAAGAAYTVECYVFHGRGIRVVIVAAVMFPIFWGSVMLMELQPYFPLMYESILLAVSMCAALMAMGLALGAIGLTTPRHFRARILSLFWLTYMSWECAFAFGQPMATNVFKRLNQWLPATIVIFWFVVFGFVARANEEV